MVYLLSFQAKNTSKYLNEIQVLSNLLLRFPWILSPAKQVATVRRIKKF